MSDEPDLKKEYIQSIKEEIERVLPGVVFLNTHKVPFLFAFKASQQNPDSLQLEEGDGPEQDTLKLDCSPYATKEESRYFQILMAHPRSKEEILSYFYTTVKNWISKQRSMITELEKQLDTWTKNINST